MTLHANVGATTGSSAASNAPASSSRRGSGVGGDVGLAPNPVMGTPLLAVYPQPRPTLVGGHGVELVDEAGRRYLDFASGIGVNALGYADVRLKAAMHDAVEQSLIHASNLYRTRPAEQLAAALVERSFADKVFFCNSGAEANEAAFKFARRWARRLPCIGGPAKHEIIALRGGFHGRLFATLAATDRPCHRLPFRPLAGGIAIVERDLEALDRALSAEVTAALIVEPIQGEGGVRVFDPDWLQQVRTLTHERRIALILDEIQCGLGRTGRFFAYEHAGIVPDLLTLAKPLAGGLPMGAVLMTAEIAAAIEPGDHGTTFGGGPFVASIAHHMIQRLSDDDLLTHVRDNGTWLETQLAAVAARCTSVRAVRGLGYMWGLDVSEAAAYIATRARDLGLLICTAGPHTLRLLPPLVTSRDDLARGIALLEEALQARESYR